jgi:hypothetical protein
MRFDTLVTFHKPVKTYDPDKGEYDTTNEVLQTILGNEVLQTILGNVVDTGTDRATELFGDVDTKSKTICLSEPVSFDWEWLTLPDDAAKYIRLTSRKPLNADTLIVGESHE